MHSNNQITLIRNFYNSDRKSIVVAIIASVVSGASSALLVGFIGKQFISTQPFGFVSIATFVSILVLSIVTSLFSSKVLIATSSEYNYSLRMVICRRIISARYEYIERIGKHRIIAMLSEDLNSIAIAFTKIPELTTNFARVLFCFMYLFWIAPVAISILMLLSIPVIYMQMILYRKAKVHTTNFIPIRDRRYDLYGILTTGFKELAINRLTRLRFFDYQLNENAKEFRTNLRRIFMANQYAITWGQSWYFIIIFGLLIVASYDYLGNEVVAAITLVGLFMRSSIYSLLQIVPIWMKASVAADKINSLRLPEECSELFLEKDNAYLKKTDETVVLKMTNVQYSYEKRRSASSATVGPLNLEFSSGELIFITGGNGSGKTTIVNLLTSLYEPQSGYISLNNLRLDKASKEWYLSHFYAIFSDIFLLNELLHNDSAKEMSAHLERLRLDKNMFEDANEIDFNSFSTGQQARLALLPIYLMNKPILIFDEWAAHQDPDFKKMFYLELLPELKRLNKLVMVVTHDSHYFSVADRVVRIESGRVQGN